MFVEMKVRGLALDAVSNMPIIILRDDEDRRSLQIWVGIFEANAIALELEKVPPPRPMTHDLIKNILEDVLDQVVRHRPRRGHLLQLEGDRVRLEDPDPDLQRAPVLVVTEDDDRHVRHGVERQPANLHFDKHGASSACAGSVPRRLCESTSVTRTRVTSPTDTRPCPSKLTTRLQRVRPESSLACFFDTPSTSTSSVLPRRRRLRSVATRSATSRSRPLRWALTSSGTWSAIAAAGVPGRREYRKTKTLSYPTRSTMPSVCSKSSSVSPGNPTITSVENAISD